MALIFTIGLTSLWPISIGLSVIYLIWRRNEIRVPQSRTFIFGIFGIAAIILATVIYSPTDAKGVAIYHAATILLVPILIVNIKSIRWWLIVLSGVQIIWVIYEFSNGVHRPSGLSDNGSSLGIFGLMALNPLSVLVIGLSLSRTALLGLAIFAVLRNRRIIWIMLILTFAVHVSMQLWIRPERLSSGSVIQAVELRIDVIAGESRQRLFDPTPIPTGSEPHTSKPDRELKPFGYGYGGYVTATGKIQPHNIYILSVWELGILAIPFWMLIVFLAWKSRNPYMIVPAILALNVDEWFTLSEGIFYLGAWHIITRDLTIGLTIAHVRRILIMWRSSPILHKR